MKPNRLVALIRGINVGRAHRVAMADLRALFEDLGFREVRTLLNSGNVVFTAGVAAGTAAARIEAGLAGQLGVPARVIVLTAAEFIGAVAENRLGGIATDRSRLLLAFLADPAHGARLKPLLEQDWSPEILQVGSRVAYLWCPDGLLAGRLPEAIARQLGDAVTIRNWATVTKLHRLLAPER